MFILQRLAAESQQAIQAWWQQRAAREQRVLILGILATVVIVLYILLEALIAQHKKLNRQLPNLRNEAAQSFFYADQLQKAQKKTHTDLRKTLLKAMTYFYDKRLLSQPLSEKLTHTNSRTQNNSASAFRIDIKAANAIEVLNWIEILETRYALTLHEVSLQVHEQQLSGYIVVIQNRQ